MAKATGASSTSRSTSPVYLLCIDSGANDDLQVRRLYRVIPDPAAARSGYVRPASLGIAGSLQAWNYERAGRSLTVRWRTDPDVDAPTQMLMPALLYGKSGHDATVTLSPAALRHKWSGDVLVIDQRELERAVDAILTVTVTNGTSLSD